MAEIVAGAGAGAHVDPDAQATVTDFIDYTEHLPSDVRRSLELISKLNQLVSSAHGEVHELTRQWSGRVEAAGDGAVSAEQAAAELRARISHHKELGRTYARASLAEARRIDVEIARHQNLLRLTAVKLDALPLPPERDPTPKPALPSPQTARKDGNEPKIKLRLDKNSISATGGMPRPRRRRLLVVPGEVLPPPNPNSPTPSFSEWDSPSPAFSLSPEPHMPPKRKYKKHKVAGADDGLPKKKKERAPREPGRMGTNVHSAVAGISTSNALLLLTPPPADTRPGSRHAPWMRLTEYEMAKLRKRMKKNAVWTPSDTMIRRELNDAGRGPENYLRAKKRAEETGEEFIDLDNLATKSEAGELQPGEILLSAKTKLTNKGMSLNAQKKQKKLLALEEAKGQEGEDASGAGTPKELKLRLKEPSKDRNGEQGKEQGKSSGKRGSKGTPEKAKQDARFRAETMESQLSMLGPQLRNLFARPGEEGVEGDGSRGSPTKKRKRDAGASQLSEESQLHSQLHSEIVVTPSESPATAAGKQIKKRKTSGAGGEDSSPQMPSATTTTTRIPLAPAAPSPSKDAAGAATPTARRTEPRRQSLVIKPPAPPSRRSSRNSTPAGSRPPSRASARRASSSGPGAASAERARRLSATPASAAIPGAAVSASRRRRPAPGPVTASQEGGYAISIGRRQKKPGKKAAAAARKAVEGSSKDDPEDEAVDPNEPRYCVCGDVSWGTMVQCENDECENQWFHLECVGLSEIPPRRRKWWCPDCMVKLNKAKA